jgi:hypothetical protein
MNATFTSSPNFLLLTRYECFDNVLRSNVPQTSDCSSFNAISKANVKRNKGLRATGIAMVTCARHELVRPQGVGDLQVGER